MSAKPILARPAKGRKPPPSPTPPATLTRITAEEAGALLGMSRYSVYEMARRGQLPAQPIGVRRWRFFKEPLIAWREKHLAAGLEGQP